MAFVAPYKRHNFLGSHAGDAACLTFIRACLWDSAGNGTGNPQKGMIYFDTVDAKLCYYAGSTPWTRFTAGTKILNVAEDTSPQLGGNLDVNGKSLRFYAAPGSGYESGDVILHTVDTNAVGVGALLMMSSDGNLDTCDRDDATLWPPYGIAMTSGTGASKRIFLNGIVENSGWSWTVGGFIYPSATAGQLTQTAPTPVTTERVKPVGIALSATAIYFNAAMNWQTYYYTESEGPSVITSSTWTSKVSISSLPAGNWELHWYCEVHATLGGYQVGARVRNTTDSTDFDENPEMITEQYSIYSGIGRLSISGAKTIALQYHSPDGNQAYIQKARIYAFQL